MNLLEKWSGLLAMHTYLILCLIVGILAAIVLVVVVENALSYNALSLYDWYISGDSRVEDYETVILALAETAMTFNLTSRSRFVDSYQCCSIKMIYQSPHTILTLENVQDICEFEKLIFEDPQYPLYCRTDSPQGNLTKCSTMSTSLAGSFYDFSAPVDCAALNESEFQRKLSSINHPVWEENSTLRSQITLGGPLGSDTTQDTAFTSLVGDVTEKQFSYYSRFYKSIEEAIFVKYAVPSPGLFETPYHMRSLPLGKDVTARFYAYPIYVLEFTRTADKDVTFVIFAILLVYGFSYLHVRSHFLCFMAINLVSFSLIVGIFVYRIVLGITYFTTTSLLVLFIILGIGADSFFVMFDAWRHSEKLWSTIYGGGFYYLLEVNKYGTGQEDTEIVAARLEYTFRTASASIFSTALTTVVAFLATATSSLLPIRTFGYFAAIVVSINMLWTLTAFPVLLVIYDKRFKNSSSKCCAASDDFQYTTEEPTKEEDNKSDRCENGKLRGSAVARAYFKTISKHTNLRLCGREFKILYVAMMLVCCSLATGAFMCSQALLLQTPSGQEALFQEAHMFHGFLEDYEKLGLDKSETAYSMSYLGFGFKGIDRRLYDEYAPNGNRGRPIFNPEFNPLSSAGQRTLLDVCSQLEDLNCTDSKGHRLKGCLGWSVVRADTVNCVMQDFHTWFNRHMFDSIGNGESLFDLGEQNKSFVENLFIEFASGRVRNSSKGYLNQVGVVNGELKYIVVDFLLNLESRGSMEMTLPVLQAVSDYVAKLNIEGSTDVLPAILANNDFIWVTLHTVLLQSLYRGLHICFPVILVILIAATSNLFLAAYAVVTIILTFVSCLGFIKVLGWTLGTIEVVLAIIIIGLSVDYVIHLGHVYRHAGKLGKVKRATRVEHMIIIMFDTVIAAWLTTTASALVLLGAIGAFFVKMSILISGAMSMSVFYCYVFFVPLCILIGPEGNFGQLPRLSEYCTSNTSMKKDSWRAGNNNDELLDELSDWQLHRSVEVVNDQ